MECINKRLFFKRSIVRIIDKKNEIIIYVPQIESVKKLCFKMILFVVFFVIIYAYWIPETAHALWMYLP